MIKLIATDIDGTLLDDSKQLPQDFFDVIEILNEKKISFAISSGRSYSALISQFRQIADKVCFICDNGANVVNKGKVVSRSAMPKKAVEEVLKMCKKHGLTPFLCAENGTYYSNMDVACSVEVAKYYDNTVHLENLSNCDDNIFKIAIYKESGIEEKGFPALKNYFGDSLTISLSGVNWVDVMNPNINKGHGICILQNKLGASYEETMAFGDYLNDIEMLENSYYSYAMSNAHPAVKKVANFSTGSNNEGSVTREILRLIK